MPYNPFEIKKPRPPGASTAKQGKALHRQTVMAGRQKGRAAQPRIPTGIRGGRPLPPVRVRATGGRKPPARMSAPAPRAPAMAPSRPPSYARQAPQFYPPATPPLSGRGSSRPAVAGTAGRRRPPAHGQPVDGLPRERRARDRVERIGLGREPQVMRGAGKTPRRDALMRPLKPLTAQQRGMQTLRTPGTLPRKAMQRATMVGPTATGTSPRMQGQRSGMGLNAETRRQRAAAEQKRAAARRQALARRPVARP